MNLFDIIELMRSRQALGLAEYGVPVRPYTITPRHLTEEVLDALVYARALELKEQGVECDDVWEKVIEEFDSDSGIPVHTIEDVLYLLKGCAVFLEEYERRKGNEA